MSSMSYQGYTPDTIDKTQGWLEHALGALQASPPDLLGFINGAEGAWEASQALDPDRDPRVTADTYHGVDDGAWDELTTAWEAIAYILHVRGQSVLDGAKYASALDGANSLADDWVEDGEVAVDRDADDCLVGDGGPAYVAAVIEYAVSAVDQCLSCCR